jgi:thiol-disulfide isomerase/thioredoxin
MKKICIMSLTIATILAGCGGSAVPSQKLPAISPTTVGMPVVNGIGDPIGEIFGFSWENPDGTTGSWKPARNTLVAFWVYGCAACLPEIQAVEEFSRTSKLEIVVVNLNRLKDINLVIEMLNSLKEPLTVQMVLDPTSDVGKLFGVQTVPDAMIVDAGGKILARKKGRVDLQTLLELEKKSEVR